MMETMHFHRLLVMDGKAICGVVTLTDIVQAIRRLPEVTEFQQPIQQQETADLLQRVIRDT